MQKRIFGYAKEQESGNAQYVTNRVLIRCDIFVIFFFLTALTFYIYIYICIQELLVDRWMLSNIKFAPQTADYIVVGSDEKITYRMGTISTACAMDEDDTGSEPETEAEDDADVVKTTVTTTTTTVIQKQTESSHVYHHPPENNSCSKKDVIIID
jgi:hypothetical protein